MKASASIVYCAAAAAERRVTGWRCYDVPDECRRDCPHPDAELFSTDLAITDFIAVHSDSDSPLQPCSARNDPTNQTKSLAGRLRQHKFHKMPANLQFCKKAGNWPSDAVGGYFKVNVNVGVARSSFTVVNLHDLWSNYRCNIRHLIDL